MTPISIPVSSVATVPPPRTASEIETYFSRYKLEVISSFEDLVKEYCNHGVIYEDLAGVLEDIGQDFWYFSDLVNQEIKRRRTQQSLA